MSTFIFCMAVATKGAFKKSKHGDTVLTVWDAQQFWGEAVTGKTPCASCGGRNTTRHGFVPTPRRVVGVGTVEWLTGGLYQCKDCCRCKQEVQARALKARAEGDMERHQALTDKAKSM